LKKKLKKKFLSHFHRTIFGEGGGEGQFEKEQNKVQKSTMNAQQGSDEKHY
jgi:hypothetical protein